MRTLLHSLLWTNLLHFRSDAATFHRRQRSDLIPTQNVCVIMGASSALLNDKIWFTGGEYSYDGGGNANVNPWLLYSLPLDKPFSTQDFLAPDFLNAIVIPSQDQVTNDVSNIFTDDSTLYLILPNSPLGAETFPSYNTTTGEWADKVVSGTTDEVTNALTHFPGVNFNQGISIPETGVSYYLGTWNPPNVTNYPSHDEGSNPWFYTLHANNGTLSAQFASNESQPLIDSTSVFWIRAGDQGVLVTFGGLDPSSHTQFRASTLNDYKDMGLVSVFDIASSTWYNVTAGGDVPESRIAFCGGVSTAPDGSSFQITIYGGYNLLLGSPLNDVYVLSLPSFTWIDVTPSNLTFGDNGAGRLSTRCQMVNDSQLVVVGGDVRQRGVKIKNSTTSNHDGCQPQFPPALVLDTTTFEWLDQYTPGMKYSQPEPVYKAIGGDASGNAPAPQGLDPALSSILQKRATSLTTPAPATISGSATAAVSGSARATASSTILSGGATNPPPPSKISGGAIAGAVIGALAGLAIIIGAAYWLLRRRQRNKGDSTVAEDYRNAELPGDGTSPVDKQLAEMPAADEAYELDQPHVVQEMHAGYENSR